MLLWIFHSEVQHCKLLAVELLARVFGWKWSSYGKVTKMKGPEYPLLARLYTSITSRPHMESMCERSWSVLCSWSARWQYEAFLNCSSTHRSFFFSTETNKCAHGFDLNRELIVTGGALYLRFITSWLVPSTQGSLLSFLYISAPNSTVEDTAYSGGCFRRYLWCSYTPQVPFHLYIFAATILFGLAFPFLASPVGTLYSEVLGPRSQVSYTCSSGHTPS